MAWIEEVGSRSQYGKLFADGHLRRLVLSTAPIHYDDGNGQLVDIDMTPVRVNNAQMDGWRIEANDTHYAIGQPKTGPFAGLDGVVGYGANKGASWFQFRLQGAGYLYAPSGKPVLVDNWSGIGGAPTYNRADLTRTVDTAAIGASTVNAQTLARWNNLWTTPNGGTVYIRWRFTPRALKEEVVIDQRAREWISTNMPPATPASETYFGLVFRVAAPAQAKWLVNDVLKSADDFDDRDGGIEMRDSLDNALAFMPIDELIVGQGRSASRLRLRKRIWVDSDGSTYLAVGALASDIASLPAGDLVFDPTVNAIVSGGSDDGDMQGITQDSGRNVTSSGTMNLSASLLRPGLHPGEDWTTCARFTGIGIAQGAAVSTAPFGIAGSDNFTSSGVVKYHVSCEDADNSAALSTTAGDFRASVRPRTTADAGPWDVQTQNLDTYKTIDMAACVQEVIDRPGWVSGNALTVILDTHPDSTDYQEWRSYEASSSLAPKIDITYSVAATLTQEGYRFRNDDGSETTATWRQAQDTGDTVSPATTIRLRVLVDASGDPTAQKFRLEYKRSTDPASAYRKITVKQ